MKRTYWGSQAHRQPMRRILSCSTVIQRSNGMRRYGDKAAAAAVVKLKYGDVDGNGIGFVAFHAPTKIMRNE